MDDSILNEVKLQLMNASTLKELSILNKRLEHRIQYLLYKGRYADTHEQIGADHPIFKSPNHLFKTNQLYNNHFC